MEDYYAARNKFTRIRQKSADLRRVVANAIERDSKKYDLQLKQLKDTETGDLAPPLFPRSGGRVPSGCALIWHIYQSIVCSHVIVRSKGAELPDRVFEEAGQLAAYYSKGREADKVEIDYLEKRNVKKPNGAKPGFVVYYTSR